MRVYVGYTRCVTRFNYCYVVDATLGTLTRQRDEEEEAGARLQLLIKSQLCVFFINYFTNGREGFVVVSAAIYLKSFYL